MTTHAATPAAVDTLVRAHFKATGPGNHVASWRDNDGRLHRDNGPARIIVYRNGDRRVAWKQHGFPVRLDGGPTDVTYTRRVGAVDTRWHDGNRPHRVDGPAEVVVGAIVAAVGWALQGNVLVTVSLAPPVIVGGIR